MNAKETETTKTAKPARRGSTPMQVQPRRDDGYQTMGMPQQHGGNPK